MDAAAAVKERKQKVTMDEEFLEGDVLGMNIDALAGTF
eukprot:CAMPEP_0170481652 /NCGR_PEP_ID=MMETSP0208-20121228/2019_1 /TAXON_ID=197538 /ORGANISM="Strombidium inclinatum, Strain S3" /LENGTH=37 /DNA_ID= /DNA_START= /DNA_END= /DNA_ORIENTATION=